MLTAPAVHERDGRFMATADLAEDSRDEGVSVAPPAAEAARWVYSLAGSTGSGIGATSSLGTIRPHELILRRSADS